MILRPAFLEDAEPLARLGRESFCAAFGHLYRAADLGAFLTEVYAPSVVAAEIAGEEHVHRLASDDSADGERLLGFCKLRCPSAYTEHSDATNPIALSQLYTDPTHAGMGVGAALMRWALGEASTRGHDAMQLSVYSENYGAQRFYRRYGFQKIADIGFMVGKQRDAEFLYELRLI